MDKEDVVHIYNGILLSHKKEQNFAICSNVYDLEGIMWNGISQKEKDKHYMMPLFVESKNIQQTSEYDKKKRWLNRYREQTSGYQWSWGRGAV